MTRYVVLRATGYASGWVTLTDPGPAIRVGRPVTVNTNVSVKQAPVTNRRSK